MNSLLNPVYVLVLILAFPFAVVIFILITAAYVAHHWKEKLIKPKKS